MSVNFQMSMKLVSIFWGKFSSSVWLMMSINDPLKILSAKGGGRYLAGGIMGPGYSLGCSSRLANPMFVNGAFVALCAMIILTPGPITILLFVFSEFFTRPRLATLSVINSTCWITLMMIHLSSLCTTHYLHILPVVVDALSSWCQAVDVGPALGC